MAPSSAVREDRERERLKRLKKTLPWTLSKMSIRLTVCLTILTSQRTSTAKAIARENHLSFGCCGNSEVKRTKTKVSSMPVLCVKHARQPNPASGSRPTAVRAISVGTSNRQPLVLALSCIRSSWKMPRNTKVSKEVVVSCVFFIHMGRCFQVNRNTILLRSPKNCSKRCETNTRMLNVNLCSAAIARDHQKTESCRLFAVVISISNSGSSAGVFGNVGHQARHIRACHRQSSLQDRSQSRTAASRVQGCWRSHTNP